MKTVMIVAGESSGEWYGSLLARELRDLWPDVRILGIGGERMRTEGVELVAGISGAFGLIELLPSLKKIWESLRRARKTLTDSRPDAVVLIDFPDFNFKLGRIAKAEGIRVLYYVSPQVWAWRRGRIKTMGEIADKVAAILPFEGEIYGKAGVPCEFVGHPAMEEIEGMNAATGPEDDMKTTSRERLGLSARYPVIALLPGSRPNELKALLPVFIEFVKMFKADFSDSYFVLPLAPNVEVERFRVYLDILEREGVSVVEGDAVGCLASSDAAVIASGTATLQAALLGIPMVVVYKLSPLTYFIGKALLDIRHISLVNIVGGRAAVRELIQGRANAEEITEEIKRILLDNRYRQEMLSSMEKIRKHFSGRQPSRRVAEMIGELAGWSSTG